MTQLVTLSSKNQFTIPARMAKKLNLVKGGKIWAEIKDNGIVLKKVEDSWDSLQGSVKDTPLTKGKTVLEVIELAKKIEGKRLEKKYGK